MLTMDVLDLQEVDSLEAIVIIDNELDPISPAAPDTVQMTGLMGTIGMNSQHPLTDRGDACAELRMDDICCSAHGLSILVVRQPFYHPSAFTLEADLEQTATKGDKKHSVLFDVGPKEDAWEQNVKRLRPNLASVELIQLSHWHRDHSGSLFVDC